jgi:chaperone required for assembly of F1-ATPase
MKRFYETAARGERGADGAFPVLLDGRPVRTPGGLALAAPNAALAEAVAAEWDAQEREIRPDDMVLTQLLTTALELTPEARADIIRRTLAYLDTDLLCYRAGGPPELAALQAARWDPPLRWFAQTYGAGLAVTTGLAALAQPPAAQEAAARRLQELDDLRFTLAQALTALTGSLVLALAFMQGGADAETLYRAMYAEEDYKAALYNEAEYGAAPLQEKQQARARRDLEQSARFLALLGA